jgi:dipeptidyl aminopeptidase/acylaminoacyl peptidase
LGWAAGVAGAAPSDLFAMAVATPQTWTQGMRALVGDPVEDRDRLIERSPINHVDQIQAPLMVRQPVRDRIVRADQTDRFVKLAREAGAQVTYVQEEAAEHGALDLAYYIQRWNEIGMFVLDVLTD